MIRGALCLSLLVITPVQATTMMPPSLASRVCASTDIGVAKIERFVGYTEAGRIVLEGPFTSGYGGDGTIAMQLRVKQSLFGTALRPGQAREIRMSPDSNSELAGMQEYFGGSDTIVFFIHTPKGLRPVHDGLTSRMDLPEVKRLVSRRASICVKRGAPPSP